MNTNVHNFWRTLEQWKRVIQLGKANTHFCGKCFEPHCDCNVEFVDYSDALSELAYWADINIMEAHMHGTGLVQTNQGYDRDHVYPFLPTPIHGHVDNGIETKIPAGVPLVAYISRGTRQWYYNGKVFEPIKGTKFLQGITWGAMLSGKFHPIARYNYPEWHIYKRTPPYGTAVYMTPSADHSVKMVLKD